MDLSKELLQFLDELKQYKEILTNPDSKLLEVKRKNELFAAFPFLQEALPKKSKKEVKEEIREGLIRKSGALKDKIIELTGKQYFVQFMTKYNMWDAAFNPLIQRQKTALNFCIDAVNEAIGKLADDIKQGFRDEQGNIIKTEEIPSSSEETFLQLFDAMQFHPKVTRASKSLFTSGHYAQSIFEAFKAVENFVKEKSGSALYGRQLMATVFNEDNPIIQVPEAGYFDKDVQEGFKFLFMGASQGIRNPKAHKEIVQNDPHITLEYLGFASFLLKRIDYWEAGTT